MAVPVPKMPADWELTPAPEDADPFRYGWRPRYVHLLEADEEAAQKRASREAKARKAAEERAHREAEARKAAEAELARLRAELERR